MNLPGLITATMEKARLRGAPTLLGQLSKVPALKEKIATVTLPGGQPFSFPAYDPYWCRYFYGGKPYESDVERIFRQHGNGRILVDCGANIGYWSVRHKDFGFTDAIAIEANPKLLPLLRRNYSGRIIDKAVHSESGATLLFEGDGAIGHIGQSGVEVETIALDDLDIKGPALVKLDIEGAEIQGFAGLGDMDAIVVYEDFPRVGMHTTRYLLAQGWKIFTDRMIPVTRIEQVSGDLGKGVPWNLLAMH